MEKDKKIDQDKEIKQPKEQPVKEPGVKPVPITDKPTSKNATVEDAPAPGKERAP